MRVLMVVMLMSATLGMLVLMLMFRFRSIPLLLPEPLPRQVLLPVNVNIHLGGGNPAAHHPGNLQPRPELCRHVKRRDGLLQQPRRNSRIHQRAQKHVAAHARKTFKISNAHKIQNLDHSGQRVTQGSASLTLCPSVVKVLPPRRQTFIIGNPATSVKPASAALSVRITIFFNSLEGFLVSSSRTPARGKIAGVSSPAPPRRGPAEYRY